MAGREAHQKHPNLGNVILLSLKYHDSQYRGPTKCPKGRVQKFLLSKLVDWSINFYQPPTHQCLSGLLVDQNGLGHLQPTHYSHNIIFLSVLAVPHPPT